MAADFASLSAVDEVLLRQACLLLARSERVHRTTDVEAAIRMSSEARRLLQSLKRNRQPGSAEPSLQAYLSATYPEGADEPRQVREPKSRRGTPARPRNATGGRGNTQQTVSDNEEDAT
jgi:hypothetical protein